MNMEKEIGLIFLVETLFLDGKKGRKRLQNPPALSKDYSNAAAPVQNL